MAPIAVLIAALMLAASAPSTPATTAQNATVDIDLVCEQVPLNRFADAIDLPTVDCISWWGIAAGQDRWRFAPSRRVTRAQMATFLTNALRTVLSPAPSSPNDYFRDDSGSAHEQRINELVEWGVAQGTAPGAFSPNAHVTRGQMATFLVRTWERVASPLPGAPDRFADDTGSPHEVNINKLAALGITAGTEVGRYEPDQPVTRQQMSAFIMRLLAELASRGHAPAVPPAPVQLPNPVRPSPQTVAIGTFRTCALQDGRALCWGEWLGLGTGEAQDSSRPQLVLSQRSDWVQVTAGDSHSCTLTATSEVACWGWNQEGQLGTGPWGSIEAMQLTPSLVPGPSGVTQVAGSEDHTCAVHRDGTVSCWGRNSTDGYGSFGGALGDGTTTNRGHPAPVKNLDGIVEVAPGLEHTCARHRNGSVWCWGDNLLYSLGDGTAGGRLLPGRVPGIVDAVAIESAGSRTCVRHSDGGVSCWGALGSPSEGGRGNQATPLRIAGWSDVRELGVSWNHMCAVHADGTVSCWGQNSHGQLADPQTSVGSEEAHFRRVPKSVAGIADAVEVSGGTGQHVCVRHATGELSCWGRNGDGQLGDGTRTQRHEPARVHGGAE